MPVQVSRLGPADIDGALTCIQEAFKDDPYNSWVFSDRATVLLDLWPARQSQSDCYSSPSTVIAFH